MSLYQDRGGVLWVGTRSGGVNRWNPRTWSFGHQRGRAVHAGGPEPQLRDLLCRGPARTGSGSARFGGGLNVLDRRTGEWSQYRYDPRRQGGLSDDRVMALRFDHARLPVGGHHGRAGSAGWTRPRAPSARTATTRPGPTA